MQIGYKGLRLKIFCVYPLIILFTLFSRAYEDAQRYTFPQSLYELKAQLRQQLAHAQTFGRGVVQLEIHSMTS